jgi:hypothetical protein
VNCGQVFDIAREQQLRERDNALRADARNGDAEGAMVSG